MGQMLDHIRGLKTAVAMVVAQVIITGVNVLYKLTADAGVNLMVIVAYRFMFATVFMVPLALIVERERPKMTLTIFFQAFLSGLTGASLSQILYLESLKFISATFVSAMFNLAPAMTFVLAICFRMENLGLKTMHGKAKVLGTLVGIGGAMVLAFYKGIQVKIFSTHVHLLHHHQDQAIGHHSSLLGPILSIAACITYSLWLIIQAKMIETYPCPYTSTALMSAIGAIQSTVYVLCTEKDWSQWKLGWSIKLLTVAYTGIIGSGLLMLISWCTRQRGPLYVSTFSPLMLIMVAIAGSLFLEEKLYLGSILGAVLIVLGLFLVLWGKGKEMRKFKKKTLLISAVNPLETEPADEIIV
ncbi:hypothetical protein SLE2022_128050 [Rubroshorea leprosula]